MCSGGLCFFRAFGALLFSWAAYFLLAASTQAAAPSPARIPANGIGLFPVSVGEAVGFTVGTSGVGAAVGTSVGFTVGSGVSVPHTELPPELPPPLTGVSWTSANGLNSVTS